MKSVTFTFWARDVNGRNTIVRLMRDFVLNIAEAAAVDGDPPIRVKVSIAGRGTGSSRET